MKMIQHNNNINITKKIIKAKNLLMIVQKSKIKILKAIYKRNWITKQKKMKSFYYKMSSYVKQFNSSKISKKKIKTQV